jgi:hypothetical protein
MPMSRALAGRVPVVATDAARLRLCVPGVAGSGWGEGAGCRSQRRGGRHLLASAAINSLEAWYQAA